MSQAVSRPSVTAKVLVQSQTAVEYMGNMVENVVQLVQNAMAHAQKPDFVFPRNERVHLNRWGRQFSRLLAAEVCASASVMLDRPRSEVA